MAIENYVPTVWHGSLLRALETAHIYAQPGVVNRDYEGDIAQQGDTVRIVSIGDVSIFDYSKDTDMQAPEALNDAAQTLVVTESKAFNFAVDDIDRRQAMPGLVDEAMRRAAFNLRDARDTFVAGKHTEASADNAIGSDGAPISIDTTNAYESIIDLGVKLDESDTPPDGRFVIVPPWYHGVLLKDDRFVASGAATADARLLNGEIGMVGGFRVMKSNNVPNTGGSLWKIIAGHPMAWSFAAQINKVEAYRPERRFADAMKGLDLYGAKVVRPAQLAVLTADEA